MVQLPWCGHALSLWYVGLFSLCQCVAVELVSFCCFFCDIAVLSWLSMCLDIDFKPCGSCIVWLVQCSVVSCALDRIGVDPSASVLLCFLSSFCCVCLWVLLALLFSRALFSSVMLPLMGLLNGFLSAGLVFCVLAQKWGWSCFSQCAALVAAFLFPCVRVASVSAMWWWERVHLL